MSKDLPLSFKDVLRQMEERALKAQTGLPSCILLTPVVGPVGEVESDAVVLVRHRNHTMQQCDVYTLLIDPAFSCIECEL